MQRITNFSHIVPVRQIDITVGARAPRIAERDRTSTVPISGDIRPLGQAMHARNRPATTPIRTLSKAEGVVIDIYA
jgi:hypothetical protein